MKYTLFILAAVTFACPRPPCNFDNCASSCTRSNFCDDQECVFDCIGHCPELCEWFGNLSESSCEHNYALCNTGNSQCMYSEDVRFSECLCHEIMDTFKGCAYDPLPCNYDNCINKCDVGTSLCNKTQCIYDCIGDCPEFCTWIGLDEGKPCRTNLAECSGIPCKFKVHENIAECICDDLIEEIIYPSSFICSVGCSNNLLSDGICNPSCNTPNCNYDRVFDNSRIGDCDRNMVSSGSTLLVSFLSYY